MMSLSICMTFFITLLCFSIMMFFLMLYFLMNEYTIFFEFELLSINSSMLVMTFLIDWMSLIFLMFVSLISSMVIFYSMEYMSEDFNLNRFIMLVLMFVFSMFLLIISPNLISILLGWDGLGLVSYCLVIYFQNIKSFNAGMLTALSNRVGDVFILMAITWMLNYGSWNFIFYLDLMNNDKDLQFIGGLIMIAAMTKSAQIPFSAWLPAAMAAPTPVSALVHSSTLVTAGVYLLIRFNSLLVSCYLSQILLLLGGLTMFMAGLGANFEYDLKKIIALSTLSQLGLMMMILSMGFPLLAFFHLLTHALFKALLFMCAGVLIHSMKNFQDIRYMGSLINQFPMTMAYFNLANLALCGMPFLAGFYSKDLILEISSFFSFNFLIYFLFFFSTGLTVSYTLRLMSYLMYGNFNSWVSHSMIDYSSVMTSGMTGLFLMVVISGSWLSWLIFPVPYIIILPLGMKMMVLLVCFMGGCLGFYLNKVSLYMKNKSINKKIYYMMGSMWFLPYLCTIGVNYHFLSLGNNYIKVMDMGWSEELGAQKIYYFIEKYSQNLQIFHMSLFKLYLMIFFMWASTILFMLI